MSPSCQFRSLKHLLNPTSQTASDCNSGNGASMERSIQGLNNNPPLTNSTSSISQSNDSPTQTTATCRRVARSPTPPLSPGSDDFERELAKADSLPLPAEIQQGGHKPSELSKSSFTRPLSETNAATLKELSTYAELNEEDLKYAKGHSEIHGTDNQYIASVVFQTRILTDMHTLLEKIDSLENKVEELAHSIETPNLPNQSMSQSQANAPPANVSAPWFVSTELHKSIRNQ
ncbi:hypothetical protein DFH28DRAFT_1128079 [Melampsora americana]|nr:hypothetical protein DFH28DRAFT_1128079 [Melampsora americana]